MVKTQVQIPDDLYQKAKRVVREREISFAEAMRRGLEYIVHAYPPLKTNESWIPPNPQHLSNFLASPDDWREQAYMPITENEGDMISVVTVNK